MLGLAKTSPERRREKLIIPERGGHEVDLTRGDQGPLRPTHHNSGMAQGPAIRPPG